jgi:hypothetical protein
MTLRENNEKNVIVSLPEEFSQRIEKDLNILVSGIPVILSSNFEFLKDTWNYPNAFEFLIGTLVGNCQVSYIQAFDQLYDQMPSAQQIEEIHNVISRRKIQFEQGVSAFLEENNIK